jgi:penicillin amidase
MKTWKRRLWKTVKVLALLVVLAIVAALAAAAWRVRRAWPQTEGEITLAGLSAPVEVVRDRWGVPHLFGASETDLAFAQGYVHAQDRLWQMELNRRVASGRLAELLGPPLVDTDRYLRTLGLRRAAERDERALGREARALLEAYAAGVNAFLEGHRERLPVEFLLLGAEPEPWTPVDSLAWGKLMSFNLSLNHSFEILRVRLATAVGEERVAELLPPYPADGPVIVPAPEARLQAAAEARPERAAHGGLHPLVAGQVAAGSWASNSWVVHGSRTVSGKPLLANDTHLGLQMPSVWYEVGLHGGGLDVVGFSFPGLPLVVIGQNARAAWGITNMCSDVQDLFIERLDDPDDPHRYLAGDEWRPLERVVETIRVKGGEPVAHEVLLTAHGPLVNGVMDELEDGPPMALAWTALETGSSLVDALRRLDRAGDWRAFRAALADWEVPSVNFTYADADGNIGYQGTGRVPVRPPGADGLAPRPGWTGEADWQGFLPFDELPRSFDPPAGFIVTANNRTTGDGYPHHIAYDMADPYRAKRIEQVLAADDRVSLDDVRALQADVLSLPAAALVPYLAALAPADPLQAQAVAEVRGWDGRTEAGSAGAAVYQAWFYFVWPRIFADELGDDLAAAYRSQGISQVPVLLALMEHPDSPWFDDRRTPEVERRDDVLRLALADAVAWLADGHGDDPDAWRWGELHATTLAHAPFGRSGIPPLERLFNTRTVPSGGDVFTVAEAMPDLKAPFRVIFGVSQRFIADPGAPRRSLAVNSTGQVAALFHRHREDQFRLWAAGEYHPVLPDREAVERAAEAHLRLVPAPPG